jgi:hypothetical protein
MNGRGIAMVELLIQFAVEGALSGAYSQCGVIDAGAELLRNWRQEAVSDIHSGQSADHDHPALSSVKGRFWREAVIRLISPLGLCAGQRTMAP